LGIEGFVVEGLEVLVFELDFFDLFFLEEDAEEVNHQPMMRFELEGEGSKDVYISGGKEAAVTQSRSCRKVCVYKLYGGDKNSKQRKNRRKMARIMNSLTHDPAEAVEERIFLAIVMIECFC
jgi:hypothetical protein